MYNPSKTQTDPGVKRRSIPGLIRDPIINNRIPVPDFGDRVSIVRENPVIISYFTKIPD